MTNFTNSEFNAFKDNEEFIKATKPANYVVNSSRILKVNPKDVFTMLGKCKGLIWDDGEERFCKKLSKIWLAEKRDKLFFLYTGTSASNDFPDYTAECQKFKDFHWGLEPREILSLDYTEPGHYKIIGMLRGIMYETTKQGDDKNSIYIHAFDPEYPMLIKSKRRYHIMGGRYVIEEGGIVH